MSNVHPVEDSESVKEAMDGETDMVMLMKKTQMAS